jgi:hypothetical protein
MSGQEVEAPVLGKKWRIIIPKDAMDFMIMRTSDYRADLYICDNRYYHGLLKSTGDNIPYHVEPKILGYILLDPEAKEQIQTEYERREYKGRYCDGDGMCIDYYRPGMKEPRLFCEKGCKPITCALCPHQGGQHDMKDGLCHACRSNVSNG